MVNNSKQTREKVCLITNAFSLKEKKIKREVSDKKKSSNSGRKKLKNNRLKIK